MPVGVACRCGSVVTASGSPQLRSPRLVLPGSAKSSARCRARCCAVRERKDPSQFRDMDELRAYLHTEKSWMGSVAGALNWLSDGAFGAQHNTGSPLDVRWLYRKITGTLQHPGRHAAHESHHSSTAGGQDEHKIAALAALMVVSVGYVRKVATRFPPLLSMPPHAVLHRMLCLKDALPRCDVARMIELQPRLLLSGDTQWLISKVRGNYGELQRGLHGADIDAMVQEDPRMLFYDGVSQALTQLRDLWPVDEAAFRNSDPAELALAVRAFLPAGLPRKWN